MSNALDGRMLGADLTLPSEIVSGMIKINTRTYVPKMV